MSIFHVIKVHTESEGCAGGAGHFRDWGCRGHNSGLMPGAQGRGGSVALRSGDLQVHG